MRNVCGWYAALASITLMMLTATQAAEPVATLARVTTNAGKVVVGELVKDDGTKIRLRDLDSGADSTYERSTLRRVDSPVDETDMAKYLGLPKLVAWKISHLPDQGPIVGKIAKVTPTVVYLNIGEVSGIAPDQQLTVYRNAEEVIDPDTKEVLARERQKLAKLQVVEVAKNYSKAKMLGELETPLEIGDEVESADEKLLIAVLPIRGGDDDETGNILTEQFTTTLANKKIPLVERALLDKVLVEQIVQNTPLFDERTAQQIGQLLGATAVLTGKIVGRNEAHVRLIQVSNGRILLAASQQLPTARPTAPVKRSTRDPEGTERSSRSEPQSKANRNEVRALSSNVLPGFAVMRNQALMTKAGLEIEPNAILRSKTGDYLTRNFHFEIVFTFPQTSSRNVMDQMVHVGIGDDSQKNQTPGVCVGLIVRPGSVNDGRTTLLSENGGQGAGKEDLVGFVRRAGPHRILIDKIGPAITFRLDMDNDGPSVDDLETTIPDLAEFAPRLNAKNSFLYVAGGAAFNNPRLGPAQSRDAGEIAVVANGEKAELLPFSRGKPWPSFLRAGDNAMIVKEGLEIRGFNYVTTKRADFIDKDFTFEVELIFPLWTERSILDRIAHVGIGEPTTSQSPETSVCMTVRPPDVNDGYVSLESSGEKGSRRLEKGITNIRTRGPHLLRIQKLGSEVTFSMDIDADGDNDDDAEVTIPDIAEYAPFLHKKNSYLIMGGGGIFTKVRLKSK